MHETPIRRLRPSSAIEVSSSQIAADARAALTLVTAARDLTSVSDELARAAGSSSGLEFFATSTANVLRAIDIPPSATVLEIGAGGGAFTRYLGESAAVVDSIEPDAALAAVAQARCADLPGVAVFDLALDELPGEAAYDIVVDIDGTTLASARALDRALAVLRPDGALVVGNINPYGASRVARGDVGGSGLGLTVPELHERFERTGLTAHVLSVMQSLHSARVVMDAERLATAAPDLISEVPQFPEAAGPVDERRVWRDLAGSGIASPIANAHLVIASREPSHTLWPADRLAVFWSLNRATAYSTAVTVTGNPARVERRPLSTLHAAGGGPLRHLSSVEDYVHGTGFLDAFVRDDFADSIRLLVRWAELVRSTAVRGSSALWDFVPHNMIVREDGELVAIDQEWELEGADAEVILRRGIYWLAVRIVKTAPREIEHFAGTTRDLMLVLGPVVGLDPTGLWIEDFLGEEAVMSSRLERVPEGETPESFEELHRGALRSLLGAGLTRDDGDENLTASTLRRIEELEAQIAQLRHDRMTARDHIIGLEAQVSQLITAAGSAEYEHALELDRLFTTFVGSPTWRIGRAVSAPARLFKRS
jgi:SAM-dependent methyltransferase